MTPYRPREHALALHDYEATSGGNATNQMCMPGHRRRSVHTNLAMPENGTTVAPVTTRGALAQARTPARSIEATPVRSRATSRAAVSARKGPRSSRDGPADAGNSPTAVAKLPVEAPVPRAYTRPVVSVKEVTLIV